MTVANEPIGTPARTWRTPVMMLMIMAAAMHFSFATWQALLNNFAVDRVAFSGAEIGILQSIREIPGFLAFAAIFLLFIMREQVLALVSLALLAIGTAATGFFPTEIGFYATTLLMSLGFHYWETMNQSLALQWLPKGEAPRQLGKVISAGAFATITTYGLIFVTWRWLELDFKIVYVAGGAITMALVIFLCIAFPQFREAVPQRKHLLLRQRYWLYYALTFMSGARRQIFIVFAGFMMVERFGFSVPAITAMFLANAVFNMLFAPRIGGLIGRWGERRALMFEYVGLIMVFTAYAFVSTPWIAAGLYLADHAFFALAIAMKTYFQKIADPADIAPTAGVAFSINHIAAIFIPVLFGLLWLWSPKAVFLAGAGMAGISLTLAMMVPRRPEPGHEVVWRERATLIQPAE